LAFFAKQNMHGIPMATVDPTPVLLVAGEVVAQVLDYASWAQNLAYEEITALYSEQQPGQRFEQAFSERFDADPPESLNENHQLIVVAKTLSTVGM
jgi:hypothetical protein